MRISGMDGTMNNSRNTFVLLSRINQGESWTNSKVERIVRNFSSKAK
jgi:hypothetical protein